MRHYSEGKGPSTPWGRGQYVKTHARGVAQVGTAGHGGFRVSRGLAAKRILPKILKAAIETSGYFWFEEDCAYSLVVLSLPELFEAKLVESARSSARDYYPEEYELITDEKIPTEDSHVLRKRAFDAETHDRFVVCSACGDWKEGVPKGMVEVVARRKSDGAEQVALVTSEAYARRSSFGYVI